MNSAEQYITGLKNAYLSNGGKEIWDDFEKIKHGASEEDIAKIKELYPEVPASLLGLLQSVDGTYFREYAGEKVLLYFLGSDVEEYPYYLLSSKEIAENKDLAVKYYSDYITREYDDIPIDEKITDKVEQLKWLHFSDCMNNGGTSQLFIDFSPSEKGKSGQVVRFLHDPDSFRVIADSFDEYLQKLQEYEYNFIQEEFLE